MADPFVRRPVAGERPGQLHQRPQRRRRGKFGIVHRRAIPTLSRSFKSRNDVAAKLAWLEHGALPMNGWKRAALCLLGLAGTAAAVPPARVSQLGWMAGDWVEERHGAWT